MSSFQIGFKYIIIGDAGCGKSSLMYQFTDKHFDNNRTQTIGVEFCSRNIVLGNKLVQLQIWDTAGQDKFFSICKQYYRGSAVAIIVYDVTRRQTFHHATKWITSAKNLTTPNTLFVLIGNKLDLASHREVSFEEGQAFAREHNLDMYVEASAKTGEKVEQVFVETAQKVFDLVNNGTIDSNGIDTGVFENKLNTDITIVNGTDDDKKNSVISKLLCSSCKQT